jgi:hypothetical protein
MGSSSAVICTYTHLTMQLDMHPCAPRHKNGYTRHLCLSICVLSPVVLVLMDVNKAMYMYISIVVCERAAKFMYPCLRYVLVVYT